MDRIQTAIQLLRKEHQLISGVIHQLEALQNTPPEPKSTRGRKSMGMEERKEVSVRMSRYWAIRRKAKGAQS